MAQQTSSKSALDRVPTANIILAINSSDLTEGAVTPESITFTNENWNIPQTVTITGQDDAIDDGDQDYHIVLNPTSDDYDDLDALNLDVTNRDDDTAGITITSISGLVRQTAGHCIAQAGSGYCSWTNVAVDHL